MSIEGYVAKEEYHKEMRDYGRQVAESGGFNMENVTARPYFSSVVGWGGYDTYDCQQNKYYPDEVNIYAKVGLHRYNLLEGTSFKLDHLEKFNMRLHCLSSYYITLVAHDPLTQVRKTFQVDVNEGRRNVLNIGCPVARPKYEVETPMKPFLVSPSHRAMLDYLERELPDDWPSEESFLDTKRFYLLTKSEWEANDWVSTYLEAAVYAENRFLEPEVFPGLQILTVAVEEVGKKRRKRKDVDERVLKAKMVQVYITFKGLAKSNGVLGIGEHLERRVMVSRVLCQDYGKFTLRAKIYRGHTHYLRKSPQTSPTSTPPTTEKKKKMIIRDDFDFWSGHPMTLRTRKRKRKTLRCY